VHALDEIEPLRIADPGVKAGGKGLVEMRYGGDIPGVTG